MSACRCPRCTSEITRYTERTWVPAPANTRAPAWRHARRAACQPYAAFVRPVSLPGGVPPAPVPAFAVPGPAS